MRARFLGASSYDDDEEYDEEEQAMDMSGFIGSTVAELPPPLVVERKRASRESTPTPSLNEGLGNMGPRSVPPPQSRMSNIGYTLPIVNSAATNEGSPFNPLWADDDTFGWNWLPVVSKTGGLALVGSSILLARGLDWGPKTKTMLGIGSLMYAHPVLGLKHGIVQPRIADWNWASRTLSMSFLHASPLIAYKTSQWFAQRGNP